LFNLRTCFNSLSEYTKLIVLNSLENTKTVEVIDFSNNSACEDLQNYPIPTRGSVGGLIDNKIPMVCGGKGVEECYQYNQGQWQPSAPMLEVSFHSTCMATSPYHNSTHNFFVLGGQPPATSIEVLTTNGWEMVSRLPKVFFHNCILNLDDKSIILIAGAVDNNWYSKETYIYNTLTDAWTTGPSLANGRYAHGCEKIPESSQSNREVIIAVGGMGSPQTVEILDGINNIWKMGIIL
jgi:hypothetical protein